MNERTMRGGSSPEFFEAAWDDLAPWDIGRAQADIVKAHDDGLISGAVLDLGCGSGEHALLCAERGHEAWGIDVVPRAVALARDKAEARGLEATFIVGDALEPRIDRMFEAIIDVGLFHALSDDDRRRYERVCAQLLTPGGLLLLLCFSEHQPGSGFPRRIGQHELRATFEGWGVEDIREARYETVAPGGGPWSGARAWLLVARRTGGPDGS